MTHYPTETSSRRQDRLVDRANRPIETIFRGSRWLESVPSGLFRLHRFGHGHDHDEPVSDVEADVLAEVRKRASDVHERLAHDHDIFAVEFAGSTGGGKTMLIERLIERAPEDEQIGVVVGDVAGEDDAERLREHGVAVENVNTGKECHLDPMVISDAIASFDLDALDTLYFENVGNMVCPADFPLGANSRVLVVSTTEGDDVIRKHPMLVQTADVVVINKVDLAEAVGTDVERIRTDVRSVAPDTPVFETDARNDVGVDALVTALQETRNAHDHGDGHHHDETSNHEEHHVEVNHD